MKLAIVSQDGKSDFICPKDGPWFDFYEKLRSSQFFEIVSLKHNPDAIIFNNHSEKVFYTYGKNIPSSKKLLILWESSVTKPSNFVRNLLNLYGKIFSPSSLWLEGENVENFRWPQQLLTSDDDSGLINYTERKQKVILLNSNKYSFEKGQMYVFRRRIATLLEDEIDIYGEGWSNRTGSYFELAKSFIG